MQTNSDFRFEVSLSRECFIDKTISNAMIGKTCNETRDIRKQYGYDPRRGVSFEYTIVTPEELLNHLIKGRVVCQVFNSYKKRKDGSFGSKEKKNINFCYGQFIGVDVDKTNYSSPEQFIERLRIKPTFWYTSYSNMQFDEEKQRMNPRFRLIYVFNSYIVSPLYFRYCVMKLNDIIKEDTGENVDECNLRCSQYYNGTCIHNTSLIVSYGITNTIYSLEDIGVPLMKSTNDDYIDFLCRLCDYSNPKPEKRNEIKRELRRVSRKDYFYNYRNKRFETLQNNSTTINGQAEKDRAFDFEFEYVFQEEPQSYSYSASINTILYDWDTRTLDDFKKCTQWVKYLENIKYVYRVEKDWGEKNYQWVDEDYFSLFHYTSRQHDRMKRRRSLFERMCLRRLIKPEITKDEMVVNTIIDIIRYFDREDGVLNSVFIRNNVDSAYSYSLDEIREMYEGSIDYLKRNTRPKRGYIIKTGVADSQEITYEILDDIYIRDDKVSVNYRMIKEHPQYDFYINTLYEYCDNRGIKTDKDKLSDEEIMELIDSFFSKCKIKGERISKRNTYKWFKDNGFKVGDKRLRKFFDIKIKEYEEKTCRKEDGVESQISSTTINEQAEKDRTFDSCHSTGDWKVDKFLYETTYNKCERWDEEYNEDYYCQKEIYSNMTNEDILDDILDFCKDYLEK